MGEGASRFFSPAVDCAQFEGWPMPKVTQAHRDARIGQIRSAAHAVFARKGFHQGTMQDICTEADLSPGAVYRYFASKDEIIESCGVEAREQMAQAWESLDGIDDTIAILEKLIEGYLVDGLQRPTDPSSSGHDWPPALDIELWAESLHNARVRGGYLELIEGIVEPLTALLTRAQEWGEVDPEVDAESTARLLFGAWMGLLVQVSLDPSVSRERYADALRAAIDGTLWRGKGRFARGDAGEG
jgi:AcrR family transcriptional regulator